MAQMASAVSATAAPTLKRKMVFVGGTAGEMVSALHQVVKLLLYLAKVCALSTVAESHVRLMAAVPSQKREACAPSTVVESHVPLRAAQATHK